jgi:hypothetical protein
MDVRGISNKEVGKITQYRYLYEIKNVRWRRHVARMENMGNIYKFWSGKLRGRNYLEDIRVLWRILLKWMYCIYFRPH